MQKKGDILENPIKTGKFQHFESNFPQIMNNISKRFNLSWKSKIKMNKKPGLIRNVKNETVFSKGFLIFSMFFFFVKCIFPLILLKCEQEIREIPHMKKSKIKETQIYLLVKEKPPSKLQRNARFTSLVQTRHFCILYKLLFFPLFFGIFRA